MFDVCLKCFNSCLNYNIYSWFYIQVNILIIDVFILHYINYDKAYLKILVLLLYVNANHFSNWHLKWLFD